MSGWRRLAYCYALPADREETPPLSCQIVRDERFPLPCKQCPPTATAEPPSDCWSVVSGRAGFEILHGTIVWGLPTQSLAGLLSGIRCWSVATHGSWWLITSHLCFFCATGSVNVCLESVCLVDHRPTDFSYAYIMSSQVSSSKTQLLVDWQQYQMFR